MKLKRYILSAVCLALLAACSRSEKDDGFVKTELGFKFKHCVNNATAPKAKQGDILLGELEIRLNDTTVLSSNFGSPDRLFKIEDPRPGSIDEFLMTLHIGDSAVMRVPADSVSQRFAGLATRPGDELSFYLKIHQLISQRELSEHDKEVRDAYLLEDSLLADFVQRKYPKAEKKQSGLYVLYASASEGRRAEFGKVVEVFYTVSDTTGKVWDTNVKERARRAGIYNPAQMYRPFEFILGDDGLIAGWTEALTYMSAGQRMSVLLPSRLAYGEGGFGAIPPFTPLLFELELVSVKDAE